MMEDLIDVFTVQVVNPDGKKYDKVSRIEAQSEKLDLYMLLDLNTEIYPVEEGDKVVVLLTETLDSDATSSTASHLQGKSKADKFEYIMHGRLYNFSERSQGTDFEVYISFGGVQLLLAGKPEYLEGFKLDKNYFICLRKQA